MIRKMARIEIVGLKKDLQNTIHELHNLGAMQIDDIRSLSNLLLQPLNLTYEMVQKREKVELINARINGFADLFKKYLVGSVENLEDNSTTEEIGEKVDQVTTIVQQFTQNRTALEEDLITLSKYQEILKLMAPLLPESARKPGNATVGALLHATQTHSMNMLVNQLRTLTQGKFEMVIVKVNESTNALVGVLPREFVILVEELLTKEKITQLVLPEEYSLLSASEALEMTTKRIAEDHRELDALEGHFRELANAWGPFLRNWQVTCLNLLDEFEIYSRLGETEFTFTAYGWVPADELQDLKSRLQEKIGEDLVINQLEIPKEMHKKIPVAMENSQSIKPFENLTKMRAIPAYSDIDPSALMAIFMPLFFGMMVSDVAYGAILFFLTLFLAKKIKTGIFADLIKTIKIGSLWAIGFGFLFGEFMGTMGSSIGLKPVLLDRTASGSAITLLYMTIGVGVVHILLGLILGIANALKHKNKSHLLEKGGMFIGIIGLLVVVGATLKVIPAAGRWGGYALLAAGVIFLGISYGKTGMILGPIEFIGLLGNILSYLRIAALGLASVFLAKVANDMVGMMGNVIAGVLVSILIHSLNIIMAAFSPTIQSLRLQYVEFFRRFYEGGEQGFTPFKKRILDH